MKVLLELEKMKALFTVHELIVAIDKPAIEKKICIVVDPKISKSPEDHVIMIKCVLDEHLQKKIEPIVKKRELKIEKIEDTIVIH